MLFQKYFLQDRVQEPDDNDVVYYIVISAKNSTATT